MDDMGKYAMLDGVRAFLMLSGHPFRMEALSDALSVLDGKRTAEDCVRMASVRYVQEEAGDGYFYPDGIVPANLYGIRSLAELDALASHVSALRFLEVLTEGTHEALDASLLRRIHKSLYGDVYGWAGEYRTGGPRHMGCFALPDQVADRMRLWEKDLAEGLLHAGNGMQTDAAGVLARSWGDLYGIRPFFAGNACACMAFLAVACARTGYVLKFPQEDAMVLRSAVSFAGQGDMTLLFVILSRALCALPGGT